MSIEVVSFRLIGISPLLQHNPTSLKRSGETKVGVKKIPSEEDEAKAGEYRDADGDLCVKTVAIRSSLIAGAVGKKIGKMGAPKAVTAGVFPVGEFVKLLHPKTGKPIKTYEIDTSPAVVQKNRILRSRPKIVDWSCVVKLEIDTDFLTPQHVLDIANLAGRLAGLGDWRPQTRGTCGRYKADIVK